MPIFRVLPSHPIQMGRRIQVMLQMNCNDISHDYEGYCDAVTLQVQLNNVQSLVKLSFSQIMDRNIYVLIYVIISTFL